MILAILTGAPFERLRPVPVPPATALVLVKKAGTWRLSSVVHGAREEPRGAPPGDQG